MVSFTKSKFLSLTHTQQHRHLAELLRAFHTEHSGQSMKTYEDLLGMLNLDIQETCLEDRYHFHLHHAGRKLKEHNLLSKTSTDREHPLSDRLPVDVYLDQLRSAHNVGSITRTIEAFGLGRLLCGGLTPVPASKTAMGTEKWVSSKSATIEDVQSPIIAIELTTDAIPYTQFTYPETFTVALGNEERGCSPKILNVASHVICIPMHGRKNSLNVANAFAIIAADISCRHPNRRKA